MKFIAENSISKSKDSSDGQVGFTSSKSFSFYLLADLINFLIKTIWTAQRIVINWIVTFWTKAIKVNDSEERLTKFTYITVF